MACDIEAHKMHMCALKAKGETDCIVTLSDNPAVVCANCGATANEPQNLCAPEPLSISGK